ncbi:hypothetical protein WN943_019366 [Citrus x changshan-huyou]
MKVGNSLLDHYLYCLLSYKRMAHVAAVTGVVRAAAAAQCIPLRRRQRQCHRLQLSIATLSSTISPSLCHHSHHYQPQQSIAMSDNVEINSSSAPDLSRNVEDKIDNEVEEISVSTVNDKKSKEETRKKKKVSEAWEHFTKIMVNGEQKAKCMHCSAILKAKYQSGTSTLNRHVAMCFK